MERKKGQIEGANKSRALLFAGGKIRVFIQWFLFLDDRWAKFFAKTKNEERGAKGLRT